MRNGGAGVRFPICAMVGLLALCVSPFHAQTPAQEPRPFAEEGSAAKYQVLDGIPYRKSSNQTLLCDLYVPAGSGPWPAVLLLHGGGWSGGDRKQLRRQAAYLAERGFFSMAIDYRLAPTHPFPAGLEDARAALAWLKQHAGEYHIEADKVAAVGSSAGANLAAMLGAGSGLSPRSDLVEDPSIQAVVAFNGIFNLSTMAPTEMIARYIGTPCSAAEKLCEQASPEAVIHAVPPPFLLLHGTADQTAPYSQATSMLATLRKAHGKAELFTADGAPHTFWAQTRWTEPSFNAMQAFLAKWLK